MFFVFCHGLCVCFKTDSIPDTPKVKRPKRRKVSISYAGEKFTIRVRLDKTVREILSQMGF